MGSGNKHDDQIAKKYGHQPKSRHYRFHALVRFGKPLGHLPQNRHPVTGHNVEHFRFQLCVHQHHFGTAHGQFGGAEKNLFARLAQWTILQTDQQDVAAENVRVFSTDHVQYHLRGILESHFRTTKPYRRREHRTEGCRKWRRRLEATILKSNWICTPACKDRRCAEQFASCSSRAG
ncbi:protamine-2 [Trichinella spiralis]|uniref:protamine-2 n=1 Tax=Trichinella spiralis TaxID=6334 RepID=UPI0001EFC6CE|nr:protamine-2 [Trichinella spiralis]